MSSKSDVVAAPEATEVHESRLRFFTNAGTFEALRIRNFRLLLLGTTLSNAAQWVQQVTLSWLVFDLTGSGAMLGTMNLVRSVATVGLVPVSGAAIDHLPRRTLMILINAWLLVVSLILGILLIAGHRELWSLLLFTFLGGIAQAFDMPLRQTVAFVLVPRALASNAVALIQTGWGLMRSVGPAIGGVLILWLGPGGNFVLQSLVYGLIAINVLRITFPAQEVRPAGQSVLRNIKEGLRFVAHEPVTRTFLLVGWILPLLIVPIYFAMSPIFAKTVFHGGPGTLGLLLSAAGSGGILGGLVAASLGRLERRGLVQLSALFLTALSLVGFGLSPSLLIAAIFVAASGFFEMIFLTGNQTTLQLSIPDELRGRVTSITMLSAGLSPVGGMIAGVGADVFGPRETTVAMCGSAVVLCLAVLFFVPVVRNYSMSVAVARSPMRH